jgi:pseudouridine-5'-phosphate glycosidase
VSQRVDDAEQAAAIATGHWKLGGAGLLLANPPPESIDVETLIDSALTEAEELGTTVQGLTPFVLARLHEESGGRTLDANRKLAVANAGLAAEVAVAHAS